MTGDILFEVAANSLGAPGIIVLYLWYQTRNGRIGEFLDRMEATGAALVAIAEVNPYIDDEAVEADLDGDLATERYKNHPAQDIDLANLDQGQKRTLREIADETNHEEAD